MVRSHEPLVTDRAYEILLSCVCPCVSGQFVGTGEAFATPQPWAGKRSFSWRKIRGILVKKRELAPLECYKESLTAVSFTYFKLPLLKIILPAQADFLLKKPCHVSKICKEKMGVVIVFSSPNSEKEWVRSLVAVGGIPRLKLHETFCMWLLRTKLCKLQHSEYIDVFQELS